MAVDVRIITQITGDAQSRRALKQIQGSVQETEKSAQRATRSFGGLTSALRTLAPALGAATLVAGISKIIQVTSDAQETTGKFNAVFKDLSASVREWINVQSVAMGRSRIDFENYSATLQDTFVPMGFAREQAAEMAKQLTVLTFDLAAFHNVAESDVVRNLASAMRGNSEAVGSYGVDLTQTTLKQEIANQAMAGLTFETERQAKASARLALIIKDTADAQGAAIRESEGFSGQMRILDAAVRDLLVSLGESGLLAVATKVVTALTDMANASRDVVEAISELGTKPVEALDRLTKSTLENAASLTTVGQLYRIYTDFVAENTEELEKSAEATEAVADANVSATEAIKESSFAIDEKTQFLIANDMRMREALVLLQQMQDEENRAAEAAKERTKQQAEAEKAALEAASERAKEACGFEKTVDECGNEVWKKKRTRDKRFQRETIADLGFLKISACREIREQVACTESGQLQIESGFRTLFQRVATGTGSLGDRVRGVFETMVQGVQRALANLAADAIWNVITAIASSSGGSQFASTLTSGTRALRSSGGVPTTIVDCGGSSGVNCGFNNLRAIAQAVQELGDDGGGGLLGAIGSIIGGVAGFFTGGPAGAVAGFQAGGAIGGSFEGFQTGGDFVTQGRRLISVGEAGPERVRITPLGLPSRGAGTTVVLQGPTIFDDLTLRQFTRTLDRELSRRSLRRV